MQVYFCQKKDDKSIQITYLAFLIVTALVVGGATYQHISVTPYWVKDINMFRNYDWGFGYFPILSPVMTVLWLGVFLLGFRQKFPAKNLLYVGHFLFILITLSTAFYFAPFLLNNMGNPVGSFQNMN